MGPLIYILVRVSLVQLSFDEKSEALNFVKFFVPGLLQMQTMQTKLGRKTFRSKKFAHLLRGMLRLRIRRQVT